MSFSHRAIRVFWAGALLAIAGVAPAAAQESPPADQIESLDVTMRLLPQGATRPDAITRVIELPEAVRARIAENARERERSGSAAASPEETRRAVAARARGPEVPAGGPETAVGAAEGPESVAGGRERPEMPMSSTADRPETEGRERPDRADAEGRPDRAETSDRGDRAGSADRMDRRDLPERDRRAERAEEAEDRASRDDARERPADARDRSERGNRSDREAAPERDDASPDPERP